MKLLARNLILVFLILMVIATVWRVSTTNSEPSTPTITGCFVNFNDSNKYVLEISELKGENFKAFVAYYNNGFDSSSGTYEGKFKNSILDGIYSFTAEGTDNKRELVFKYIEGDFRAGFGEYVNVDGVERLTSRKSVKWFKNYTYSPSRDCGPPR